jgi:hypothetical protein
MIIALFTLSHCSKNQTTENIFNQRADSLSLPHETPSTHEQERPKEPKPIKDAKPVTQFDSIALDAQVIKVAKEQNRDPKKFRLIIRKDPDNTIIYRSLGMHIIVSPNGEEFYLPDEI